MRSYPRPPNLSSRPRLQRRFIIGSLAGIVSYAVLVILLFRLGSLSFFAFGLLFPGLLVVNTVISADLGEWLGLVMLYGVSGIPFASVGAMLALNRNQSAAVLGTVISIYVLLTPIWFLMWAG